MPLDPDRELELVLEGQATGLADPVALSEPKVNLVYVEFDIASVHGAAV